MPKFRSKVVEIEAFLFTGERSNYVQHILPWIGNHANFIDRNVADLPNQLDMFIDRNVADLPNQLDIHTLEGTMTASVGDWIIKGTQGEFYPCKPSVFETKYEAL